MSVRSLINHTMTNETFSHLTQPIFVCGYYKDEENQDNVVSVEAMRLMMPQLGTPDAQKRMIEFPVGAHVLTNPLRNSDVESVTNATFDFAENILGLKMKVDTISE